MSDHSFAGRTKRYQLSNGLTLLVLENHANPTVSLSGSLRAGKYFSPAGKERLAGLTAAMLNKGTAKRGKLEIAEALESAGARAGISANTFNVSISGQSLSRDLELIVSTLAEELRAPTFPEDEFEKLKKRTIAYIQEDLDDTRTRAYERMSQIVFAPESPFHRLPAENVIAQIESMTVDDLREFHAARYGAESMILAVVGDIEPDAVRALIETHLGDWRGPGAPEIRLAETPLQPEPRREVVVIKDKASCDIIIGHASRLRRSNPDFLAAVIANNVLGHSTISSRLGAKIREEMGLTYGINSSFSESGIGDGPFIVGVSVSPENIDLAIETSLEILRDYIANGIREHELNDERSSLIGSFKVGLATNSQMAGQLSGTELHGLGAVYLDEYPSIIAAITQEQVNEAIRKYIHPEIATTVIAGTIG
ncbi:MAG: pitrilysin family protein [Blastocatellia bacterium]|nr:pitrilysin family protein [Blastocatellia bacterium]